MSKIKIFKKAAILIGTAFIATTTMRCSICKKNNNENSVEMIFEENSAAPLTKNNRILQIVVLKIGTEGNYKKLFGYFYEKKWFVILT